MLLALGSRSARLVQSPRRSLSSAAAQSRSQTGLFFSTIQNVVEEVPSIFFQFLLGYYHDSFVLDAICCHLCFGKQGFAMTWVLLSVAKSVKLHTVSSLRYLVCYSENREVP